MNDGHEPSPAWTARRGGFGAGSGRLGVSFASGKHARGCGDRRIRFAREHRPAHLNGASRIWRASGPQPHESGASELSIGASFVEKGRDVVGLFTAAPGPAPVLCVDQKPQIQAVEGTAPVLCSWPAHA